MLAQDHRLRSGDAFRHTVRSGRRAAGRALVVHVHTPADDDRSSAGPVQVGLVVGKGVGNAVVRNRVSRRLRHLAREVLTTLPAGAQVVVRALPPAAAMTSAELGAELARCLERAGRAGSRHRPARGGARTGAAS